MFSLSNCIVTIVALMAVSGQNVPKKEEGGESRIIGGREATPGKYKFMVNIVIDNRLMCGGSMIGPDFVLTAAHCISSPSAGAYRIRGNIHDLGSQQSTELRAVRVIPHPGYNKQTISNDIALIQVQPNSAMTSYLQLDTRNSGGEGASVRVIGWGKTSPGGQTSRVLKELDMNIVNPQYCSRQFGIFSAQTHFCASGKQQNSETCQGDSGGPVVTSDLSTVVGVVSYGSEFCNTYGSAYARVSSYIGWINQYFKPSGSGNPGGNPGGNPLDDGKFPKGQCNESGDTICFTSKTVGVCIDTKYAHQFQCPGASVCKAGLKGKHFCT